MPPNSAVETTSEVCSDKYRFNSSETQHNRSRHKWRRERIDMEWGWSRDGVGME